MGLFKVSEIYQFAMRMEENGEKFYRHLSKTMKDRRVKELFTSLADEEIKHKRVFEDLVSKIEKYQPPESYPGEYFAYLSAYVDNLIFTQRKLEKELERIENLSTALEFAIRIELDSILYYQEMKNFISEYEHNLLEKVIEEERRHFLRLWELKRAIKS